MQTKIEELLAGYNCGGCGYDNCKCLAKAIAQGKAKPSECLPIDEENIEKIEKILKELKK